ncbi:unnamed protein product [Arabidopsis halleri]
MLNDVPILFKQRQSKYRAPRKHGIAKSDAFLASEAEAEAESQGIARNRLGIAIPKVRRLEACWNRTIRDWKRW